MSKAVQCLCLTMSAKWAGNKHRGGKISELFVYDNFNRVPVDEVQAGDICALTGLGDVAIGETICCRNNPVPLPTITVRPFMAAICQSCKHTTASQQVLWLPHGTYGV